MDSQRNLQHILITSVLSNLETSLIIPICAESSINFSTVRVSNGIKCLIGQFRNTQWFNHQPEIAAPTHCEVSATHDSKRLQHHDRMHIRVVEQPISL